MHSVEFIIWDELPIATKNLQEDAAQKAQLFTKESLALNTATS